MKKILSAILLLFSANACGQGITHLKCIDPSSAQLESVIVLDNESMQWSQIYLLDDQYLEQQLNKEAEELRRQIIEGTRLEDKITYVDSVSFLLRDTMFGFRFRLDRKTGAFYRLFDDNRPTRHDLDCLPFSFSEAQAILQDEINRRDAIIAANEEERLF